LIPERALGFRGSHALLAGIRVIELADEQGEGCGLTLAGLGAHVIKVEPPDGSPTRRIEAAARGWLAAHAR
jgi:crotonobetainyl-CoA:carnitine CoA-transferase CaiB-like acyl-CoA transferase